MLQRLAFLFVLSAAACSGSDGAVPSSSVSGTDVSSDSGPDDFSPIDPGQPIVVPVTLGEDVVIATEDGSIPTTTTEPEVVAPPDQPPPVDGPTTTVARIPVPAGAEIGRIVSMSPTHTETLFALGLGDFVVAVDVGSDYPAEAVGLQVDSLQADIANVDPIVALDPDVVVLGDDPTGMADRLSAAGIASYSGASADSLDDVYAQIQDIAELVDRPDLGEQLVDQMKRDIDEIVDALPAGALDSGLTFFHEIDPSLFTPGRDSFFSDVYETLGLANIAGPAGAQQVVQMTNDQVIAADPDVIVLADAECCAVTPSRVADRPGWGDVSAVRNDAIVEINDALAGRWGPRVVELLRTVAKGVEAAAS